MLIEKINSASFANSILRLEVATTNGKGEWVESGTLEIPGALVASVIQQMSTAASDISSQLSDNQETTLTDDENKNGNGKSKQKSKKKK